METRIDLPHALELKIRIAVAKTLNAHAHGITAFRTRDDGIEILDFKTVDPAFIQIEVESPTKILDYDLTQLSNQFSSYKVWNVMKLSSVNKYLITLRSYEK